jgi:hypothetical protein
MIGDSRKEKIKSLQTKTKLKCNQHLLHLHFFDKKINLLMPPKKDLLVVYNIRYAVPMTGIMGDINILSINQNHLLLHLPAGEIQSNHSNIKIKIITNIHNNIGNQITIRVSPIFVEIRNRIY